MRRNQKSKSWIIGMIFLASTMCCHSSIAQTTSTSNLNQNPATAGRYIIGLKYHVPTKNNGKWQFLAHEVTENTKADLVDNKNTKWQLVTARTRKIAMRMKRSNKPILVDFALVNLDYEKVKTEEEGKTLYLIYNWQPVAEDDVSSKIK